MPEPVAHALPIAPAVQTLRETLSGSSGGFQDDAQVTSREGKGSL